MDTKQIGRKIMNELQGEGYVEGKDKKATSFTLPLNDYSEEVCFGRVWARPGIDRKTRSIINVVMLTALNRMPQLRNHLEGAINNGWTPEELREVLLHAVVYVGLPAGGEAFKVAEEVMKGRGLADSAPKMDAGPADVKQTGRKIMDEVMGEGYVAGKDKERNAFNSVMFDYSEEVCFGRTWSRTAIDRKMRSFLNLAMLTALNRPNQLSRHVEGAIRHGCTMEEIREVLLQTAVYCGLPAAGESFKVAEEVLKRNKMLG